MYMLITLLWTSPCQANLSAEQGTKATIADGHTIFRGISRPDRGATRAIAGNHCGLCFTGCITEKTKRRLMVFYSSFEFGQRCTNVCMLVMMTRIIYYPEIQMKDRHMSHWGSCRKGDVYTLILSWATFWRELYFQSPSTIGEEKQYNPFLRSHSAELHLALGLQQFQDEDWTQFRARVLEELRKRKDLYNRR